MKVLLSGYYGFYNIGDEAILSSLVSKLREINPDVDITVLSKAPEETQLRLGVHAYQRKSVYHLVKEIIKTDVYISGGGSLFQDKTSNRSLLYYVLAMTFARIWRKKTASVSCGVGPLNSKFHQYLVRREIEKSVFTSLRDPESYDYLRKIGVKTDNLYVTADLAMGLPEIQSTYGKGVIRKIKSERLKEDSSQNVEKLDVEINAQTNTEKTNTNKTELKEKPVVVLALRAKDFEGDLIGELIESIKLLSPKYHLIFLPFYLATDVNLKRFLENDVRFKEIEGNYLFFDEQCSFEEYISIIKEADLLVGARLHSLIFSLIAGTEYIGLSYDPKVDAFMHLSGKKALCNIENLKADELSYAVNEFFKQSEAGEGNAVRSQQKKLADVLKTQREEFRANDELLKNLICD